MNDLPPTGMEDEAGEMSMLDHLEELRKVVLWAFALALIAGIAGWFFSDQIIDALLEPARRAGQENLYFTAPMEAFLLKLKAAMAVGLFLVFPLILHKVYSFVLPGLHFHEKRVVTPLLVASIGLFYIGVLFCYIVLMPMVIRFAVGFQTDTLVPLLTAREYFALAVRLCLAFGLLFELPMVVFALSWAGLVKPSVLLGGWRYALVAILVASAVLTPPDPISMVMLAGPVMLLYLISVLVSMAVRRKKEEESDGVDSQP